MLQLPGSAAGSSPLVARAFPTKRNHGVASVLEVTNMALALVPQLLEKFSISCQLKENNLLIPECESFRIAGQCEQAFRILIFTEIIFKFD